MESIRSLTQMKVLYRWEIECIYTSVGVWSNSAVRATPNGVLVHTPHRGRVLSPLWRGNIQHAGTRILRRFLPNKRASMDREPGPRNARAIACVARRMVLCGGVGPVRTIHISLNATIA